MENPYCIPYQGYRVVTKRTTIDMEIKLTEGEWLTIPSTNMEQTILGARETNFRTIRPRSFQIFEQKVNDL